MATPRVLSEKDRQVHTYSELWHAANCLLELAKEQPKGSTWQYLSSTILLAFAFEAYLNHVGFLTFDNWDDLERKPPLEKLNILCDKLGITLNKSTRPLQTVYKLFNFRNSVAHGRSEKLSTSEEISLAKAHREPVFDAHPLTEWEKLVKNSVFVERAKQDAEAVMIKIHEARIDDKEPLFTFGIGFHSLTLISN